MASTSWLSGSGVGLWFVSVPLEGTRIEDGGESMPVGFSFDDMVAETEMRRQGAIGMSLVVCLRRVALESTSLCLYELKGLIDA